MLFNNAVKCEDYTASMMAELMCTEQWSNVSILSFRRVLYVVCFLLGISPASEV